MSRYRKAAWEARLRGAEGFVRSGSICSVRFVTELKAVIRLWRNCPLFDVQGHVREVALLLEWKVWGKPLQKHGGLAGMRE